MRSGSLERIMATSTDYLAFDLGASSGRGVLGRFDGQKLTLEEICRFSNEPVNLLGRLHWNALDIFSQIRTGLVQATDVGDIAGVGIDTWGVDYGLITSAGNLLGLPRHYRDPRTDGLMERVHRRILRQDLYSITGIQSMPINTLCQLVAERSDDPDLLDHAEHLLFMPNLFQYWLSGEMVGEYTIASTSQLLDVNTGTWAGRVFETLDLPMNIMPPLVKPGTVLAKVHPNIAEERQVREIDVIATATHDTAAAVAATPALSPNWAYISSGTWSLVGVELPSALTFPDACAANVTNEGGVLNTIRFLKNVAGLWLLQECRRVWIADGKSFSYAELIHLAEESPARQAFINPDDPIFAPPGEMPTRIRDYCQRTGQAVPGTYGEVTRCILESLALKYDYVLSQLEELSGEKIDTVHIVGGGSLNTLLCQLTADITVRSVVAGPAEATAMGNILVQLLAHGHVGSLPEMRKVVADSVPQARYEPQTSSEWDETCENFRRMVERS
jgi:rhamnulokinase